MIHSFLFDCYFYFYFYFYSFFYPFFFPYIHLKGEQVLYPPQIKKHLPVHPPTATTSAHSNTSTITSPKSTSPNIAKKPSSQPNTYNTSTITSPKSTSSTAKLVDYDDIPDYESQPTSTAAPPQKKVAMGLPFWAAPSVLDGNSYLSFLLHDIDNISLDTLPLISTPC